MKIFKWLVALWVTLALVACGGGGGSAGTVAVGAGDSGTGTDAGASVAAKLAIQLVDGSGAVVSPPGLSQTAARYLKVSLKDAKGAALPYVRISVSLDSELAVLTPQSGAQLTDSDGVASFAIAPASVTSSGAITATANASVDGTEVSNTLDMQINSGQVALLNLAVTPTSVQLGQSVNVSVDATVNGAVAPSNSVAVDFTSTCGTVSPTSALVDSSGRASAVIQTTAPGTCTVVANTVGVSSPRTASYTVTSPPVTGIQFVQASPSVIYQQDSAGVTSSVVKFKVIDSNGNPVAGQSVTASFVNSTGGMNFCDPSASGNSAVSAASTGEVSFSVCAGSQPETAQVRATLAGGLIYTDSNILTVQTGLPTQRFFDIAADRLNFYAGGRFTTQFSGDDVNITVRLADRQGNPVPNGTPVVFVTEGGQINSSNVSSCIVSDGGCTVKLIGQEYRPLGASVGDPRPGRVTVLAMADGEESFIDANNNNRYDLGELFEDLGVPFMDKNEDAIFTATYKNLVTNTDEGEVSYSIAAAAVGTSACPTNSNVGLSRAATCNGAWNGSGTRPDGSRYTPTKVRRDIVIVFSGGEIGQPGDYDASVPVTSRTTVVTRTRTLIEVRLADLNGNPLPADATLSVNVRKPDSSDCTATLQDKVIGSAIEPTAHVATLENCAGGGVETVDFKVEVTAGDAAKTSIFSVTVP